MKFTKVVTYEIHLEVDTPIGSNSVKMMEMTCLDNDPAGMAVFEERLRPRIKEWESWGQIVVVRQIREEVYQ